MSLVSTCVGYSSPLLFVFFSPDLSITNSASCRAEVTGGPCKHSSEIDRRVRKFIAVQDTSAEAQLYGSYTLPASPPLHHPASLWGALPYSFASKLLFLPCSCSRKAGVLAEFYWLLWKSPPNIGLAWKTQQIYSNTSCYQTEEDFSANSSTCYQLPLA